MQFHGLYLGGMLETLGTRCHLLRRRNRCNSIIGIVFFCRSPKIPSKDAGDECFSRGATARNQGPGKCFIMSSCFFKRSFVAGYFVGSFHRTLKMRDLQVHLIQGVDPVSQTVVAPPPGNEVRVRGSSCRPDFVGANSIGSVQLWPAAMPARQVFCPVVRTLKLRPEIAVPTWTVPGSPTLVTVSGSTSVEPEASVLNSSAAPPDSAKHAQAGNGTEQSDGRDCRHWSLRLVCRHAVRSILANTPRPEAAVSRRHAAPCAGAVRDLIAGAADRGRDG